MSDNFILSCCSTVDLPYSYMESRHIPVLFYTYVVDGVTYDDDMGRDPQALPRFYQFLREGARNMQNYELLRALGGQPKPVLLKRAVGATVEELLQSAEYILSGGNPNVVLCERGVRSFSKTSRAALDVSVIPVLKQMTHLPVIVDPSHAAGSAALVPPLALAAVAAGADGLLIEVHDRPAAALSDPAQSMSCTAFAALAEKLKKVRQAIGE